MVLIKPATSASTARKRKPPRSSCALAKSERVEQVFVRHVFRFFTGRNENLGDGPSLRAAYQAYRKSGGSFERWLLRF